MQAETTHHQLDQAEQLARALPPLLVEAERIAATVLLGVHGRRRAGMGENFWQYRPYSFGDPVQRVDWHKSARSDRVFIRENEWEAANTLLVWSSPAPSMDFKSKFSNGPSKRDRADLAALALAALALEAQERVGLLADTDVLGHTRSALRRLAERLIRHEEAPLPVMARPVRFATAVLFGDFYDDPETLASHFAPLASAGIVGHVVQVCDLAEETLPWDGRVEFRAVTGDERFLAGKVPALREAYTGELAAHRDALRSLCTRLGWSFTIYRTDQPIAPLLLNLHGLIGGARSRAFGMVPA